MSNPFQIIAIVVGAIIAAVTIATFVIVFFYRYGVRVDRMIRKACWGAYCSLIDKIDDIGTEDDLAMPTELASWASAEQWRKSCV